LPRIVLICLFQNAFVPWYSGTPKKPQHQNPDTSKSIFIDYQSFTKRFKPFQTHFLHQNSPKMPFLALKNAQKTRFLPHFSSKTAQKHVFFIKKWA
jgi:hypothetical protein